MTAAHSVHLPLHGARIGAGLVFVVAVLLLVHAYRKLRDRARAEEANAVLREAFEHLERSAASNDDPSTPRKD